MTLKPIYTILLASVFFFLGCNSGEENKGLIVEYDDEGLDLFDFQAFSLSPYQINALIYLPDEGSDIGAATDPKILHALDDYRWSILVGQNFHLRIYDYGEDDGIVLHKEELDDLSHMYEIEFIEDEPDFIYYKRTLKARSTDANAENVGIKHVSYHSLGNHKIQGINYIFRSVEEGHPKPVMEYMTKSIKSVKEVIPS